MNGPSKSREARSRKKKTRSNGNGVSNGHNNGAYDVVISDSSASRRSNRMAMKKKRVRRSRARKSSSSQGNAAALCLIGATIFIIYLLVCLIFFRSSTPDNEAKGMRGLVKKTKEKLSNFRAKHSLLERQIEDLQVVGNTSPQEGVAGSIQKNNNANSSGSLPVGLWPISIRDEDGKFEDIKHPGFDEDETVWMSVPMFWANDPVAIHEMKLMSRERALSIGTCTAPDPSTGSSTRGDKCPLNERTIFVAIASYRDWQCRDTLTSIFSAATHPERVRVGIVDQIVEGEDGSCDIPHSPCSEDPDQPICLWKNQIDVYQMEAQLAVGPVFARHIGHRLYRGEYYYMQSDSQ